jgi:hypothetical protein
MSHEDYADSHERRSWLSDRSGWLRPRCWDRVRGADFNFRPWTLGGLSTGIAVAFPCHARSDSDDLRLLESLQVGCGVAVRAPDSSRGELNRHVCRPLRRRLLSACLAILLCGCRSAARNASHELEPEPALDYIAEAFDRYPVVALSEVHGNRESAAFLARLIRHEGFSRRVNDIVVEFGNAAINP